MDILKRKVYRTILIMFSIALAAAFFLSITTALTEPYAHIAPDYPKIDISSVISQEVLGVSDYNLLFYQTGLGKPAIDELREKRSNFRHEILKYQERFFADVKYVCEKNSLISREESVVDDNGSYAKGTDLAAMHDGDILITKASHTYGWRNGHTAIIANSKEGITLECAVLGSSSCLQGIDKWTNYPNFIHLRLKEAPEELLQEIAKSSLKNLYDIPYSLTAGIISPKFQKAGEISRTHCSHLVWESFMFFDYDLDSDGGMIVTPKDIANSPLLEIVQVYGVKPDEIWP